MGVVSKYQGCCKDAYAVGPARQGEAGIADTEGDIHAWESREAAVRKERLGSGSEPPGDEAAEGLGQGGGCHRRDADVLLIPPGVPDTDQYQQPTGTDHAGDPETVTGRSDRH